ncbi:MAG: NIL domain-containing protein [Acidimicrobiales bacterium]
MTSIRVNLTYPENLIRQPIIATLVRDFDVLANIRRASVEDTVGWMMCELVGEHENVERAMEWMRVQGVDVALLGDVVEG